MTVKKDDLTGRVKKRWTGYVCPKLKGENPARSKKAQVNLFRRGY